MGKNELKILGLRVDPVSFVEAAGLIDGFVDDGQKHLVVTPYAESVVAATRDAEFRNVVNSSALSVPDGGGILAAADFLSYKIAPKGVTRIMIALTYGFLVGLKLLFFRRTFKILKETVRGVDLLESLCLLAQKKNLRVFLLGGPPGVAERAALVLKTMYPGLVTMAESGPADLGSASAEEMSCLIQAINQFAPAFLFVAFKPGEQEKWLAKNMGQINARVFMAVGGALDMISGYKKRAPQVLRRLGLEWLWRLIIEPSRIGRIYNAVIIFPLLVFREKLRTG